MANVGPVLRLSGVITILAGAILGFAFDPIFFIGVLVGVFDLVIAMAFSRGWLGASRPGDDVAAKVEADPSYNPYARED